MHDFSLDDAEFGLLSQKSHYALRSSLAAKAMGMLGQCAERAQTFYAGQNLPEEVMQQAPKISRGENYLGFPWMVLDFPRYFKGKDTMAIRSLIWWGNALSVTLVLSGTYAQRFRLPLIQGLQRLELKEDLLVSVNPDRWQHHFGADNYHASRNTSELADYAGRSIEKSDFVKLCRPFSFEEWNHFPERMMESHRLFLPLLGTPA